MKGRTRTGIGKPKVTIQMSDEDVICRAAVLMGIESIQYRKTLSV